MCGSRDKRLVINLSYHINILFILSPFSYSITYLFWLATSYSCPSFIMLVWLYHWQSRYPFVLVPLWEWVYSNPQHISRYCHSYYFGKWSTCLKGGPPPFPSPHPMTSGYPYHQKWHGRCDCWPNSHRYSAMSIVNDNTCSDDMFRKKHDHTLSKH
jgi:hypothetical protein